MHLLNLATVSFYQVAKRVFWLYMVYSSKREEAESIMGLIYIYPNQYHLYDFKVNVATNWTLMYTL